MTDVRVVLQGIRKGLLEDALTSDPASRSHHHVWALTRAVSALVEELDMKKNTEYQPKHRLNVPVDGVSLSTWMNIQTAGRHKKETE